MVHSMTQPLTQPVAHKKTAEPVPLLLVWDWVPSHGTGAGVVLRRLLETYPSERLWLLTSSRGAQATRSQDPLPAGAHTATLPRFAIPWKGLRRLTPVLNTLLIPLIVWRGVRLVRRHSIQGLFAVPWNEYCAAAYFIHRLTGCPLFAYFMDDPLGSPGARPGFLYRPLMPRFLRAARRVWGISPAMCAHLESAYGVKCELLLPTLDSDASSASSAAPARPSSAGGAEVRIIYTGAIYGAQLDALRNLVRALNADSASPNLSLTLYTSLEEAALREMGLTGANIRRGYVPSVEMPSVLSAADVLFLPLSFTPDQRHVVETSLPTKLAEYLASGTPILVHAPPYASVAKYCREHRFGLIVDTPDPVRLGQALRQLASDPKLREELSRNARATFAANHSRETVLPRFLAGLAS
jgi:glycosyltransferase involved in cell wall biosynthesis